MTTTRTDTEFLLPFEAVDPERDGERVGKKGLELGRLAGMGLPVPDGFCITVETFDRFREQLPPEQIEELIDPDVPLPAPEDFSMPEPVAEAILAAASDLTDGPVAVRSSGTMEDLAGASFAGQYETVLGVRGADALKEAVLRCWTSVWNRRVLTYCRDKGIDPAALRMAVVVQRMVDARASGVLFTLNPLSGRENEMLVEGAWGLGELIVSGRVTPDRFILGRREGKALETTVGDKEVRLRLGSEGPKEEAVPGEDRERPCLSEAELHALLAVGDEIQVAYGHPQDVEWVVDSKGELAILQSRPITSIQYRSGLGEWTTADFRDGGVSSSVVSPFMWSLYERIWEETLPAYLKRIKLLPPELEEGTKWGRVFFGRPYWNVGAVKQCLMTIPGFNEREFDTDLGIEITYTGDGVTTGTTPIGILRALPTLFALEESFRERLKKNAAFRGSFFERAAEYLDPPPADLEEEALVERFRSLIHEFYIETESAYFYTIYDTSNAKLAFKEAFEKVSQRAEPPLSYLKLMLGLEDLSHLRPVIAMWNVAETVHEANGLAERVLDAAPEAIPEVLAGTTAGGLLERFVDRFGYHGTKELDITRPRWHEEPIFVYETLQRTVEDYPNSDHPGALNEEQHARYLEERERLVDVLEESWFYRWIPGRKKAFLDNLDRVRSFAWWREEMRDLSTRVYDLIRRHAVELGRRLAEKEILPDPEAVFALPFPEVFQLLDDEITPGEARRRVRKNRRYNASYRAFENPNEIGDRYKYRAHEEAASAEAGHPLTGVGCSPGRIEAPARVARTLDEAHDLQKGEILVTRFTDPGWTPILGRCAGVVTETGGVLSHAAVISREYGIPAVLAVPGATERIPAGVPIALDGDRGTVTVLE